MRTGFAERDITPSIGSERPGGYYKMYIESVRDPLKARAAVFDDGSSIAALVGVDTLVIPGQAVAQARKKILKACGIKADHVMIAASHTHTGGPMFGLRESDLEDAPALIKTLALECSVKIDTAYEAHVVDRIAEAVNEAFENRRPLQLSVGSGSEARCVFNRRFRMRSGMTFTHPGKGNPDIVGTAGPIDPEVGVIGGWRENGTLVGCVVNFACHGTTCPGPAASADWISAMEKTIRSHFGQDVIVVFLNGACGDVTQVDNIGMRKNRSDEWLDILGTRVGSEAVKTLVSSERTSSLEPVAGTAGKTDCQTQTARQWEDKKSGNGGLRGHCRSR